MTTTVVKYKDISDNLDKDTVEYIAEDDKRYSIPSDAVVYIDNCSHELEYSDWAQPKVVRPTQPPGFSCCHG